MTVEIANYTNIPECAEIEFAFLSGLLKQNDKYYDVCDIVKPEYFYNPVNGLCYEVIGKIINQGMCADKITLQDFMKNSVALSANDGVDYLDFIISSLVCYTNLKTYAEQIREFYIRRQYGYLADAIKDGVQKPLIELPNDEFGLLMGQKFTAIESIKDTTEESSVGDAFDSCVREIEEDMRNKENGKTSKILTEISEVDHFIGGFTGGQLITVGAGTRIGKSVFALTVAVNVARQKKEVLFCSLEMSINDLTKRLIARETSISTHLIHGESLNPAQLRNILEASDDIKSLPLLLSDDGNVSLLKLRSKALRKKRRSGLDLLIVDYLQLLVPSYGKEMNRNLEISKISRGLKMLAKELNIPIIALSQLSREVDKRQGNRPRLSDLRESGTIEQDSDIVILLFREHEYMKYEAPEKGSKEYYQHIEELYKIEDKAEINIAKNRNGITGIARVRYDSTRLVFEDHPIGKGE